MDAVRVRERFKHVADEVVDYDVVALQEVSLVAVAIQYIQSLHLMLLGL